MFSTRTLCHVPKLHAFFTEEGKSHPCHMSFHMTSASSIFPHCGADLERNHTLVHARKWLEGSCCWVPAKWVQRMQWAVVWHTSQGILVAEQHMRKKENTENEGNQNLSTKIGHQVGMPRQLFRGKFSKTVSSLKNSLPITPSSYKMTIFSMVSFSHINALANVNKGFLRWHSGKESVCQYRRPRRLKFDPWIGRSPRGGTDNPLRCSCLENSMDRGAWRATVHKVMKSRAQLRCDWTLSTMSTKHL